MIAELKACMGRELDSLSRELVERMATPLGAAPGGAAGTADRDLHRLLQRRLRFLGQLVAGLACVDPSSVTLDRTGYGSVVRLRDLASGGEESYTLMAGDFIDVEEGQVSLASPIGHALLGRRAGERVSVVTPRGERRYEIVHLTPLPAALGVGAAGGEAAAAAGSLRVA